KAQSAMEYLMTYGWAILIIAVVLGALFSLGVFNGASLLGTSCVAGSGYLCQNPVLSTSGQLTFTFGQNTGAMMYNAIISVSPQSAATVASGFPAGGNFAQATAISTLASGQTVPISVTLTTPTLLSSDTIGTPFTGYIWLNYSTTSGGVANIVAKVATITVKVS
ncbi:MAG: hypothetical protein ACP5FN_04040, partial [Candidatus Micrarchaeia archaeon]